MGKQHNYNKQQTGYNYRICPASAIICLVHWANVLEHSLLGSNVKCLTSIMMVRLGLGYCLVAAKQLCHIQSSY